jgi:hypothetical protein
VGVQKWLNKSTSQRNISRCHLGGKCERRKEEKRKRKKGKGKERKRKKGESKRNMGIKSNNNYLIGKNEGKKGVDRS